MLISWIFHYLGDYIVISGERGLPAPENESEALSDFSNVLSLCEDLGVPVASRKTIGPSTCMEFLGIILDTVRFEARLSRGKIELLLELLKFWQRQRQGSKRDVFVITRETHVLLSGSPSRKTFPQATYN